MQTVSHCAPKHKSNSQNKGQELRQQIETQLGDLASAVDEVRASEVFQAYLDVQSRFHRYSWHNCMLIASQRPTATQVAGFQAWKKLGRFVRKGERGIRILAPCPWKREGSDGNTESGVFFKSVCVFDVDQTDGAELPSVDVPDIAVAADTLLANLGNVATNRGIAVTYVNGLDGGVYGVSKGGAIDVDCSYTTGQQAKTLAHELAHEALHKGERRKGLTRTQAELEADAVAYIVCRKYGLDASVRCSRYIATWGGDSKALRASMEAIADTARAIIDEIDTLADRKAVA